MYWKKWGVGKCDCMENDFGKMICRENGLEPSNYYKELIFCDTFTWKDIGKKIETFSLFTKFSVISLRLNALQKKLIPSSN